MTLNEPDLNVKVNVKIAKREFIPDPQGDVMGIDGTTGRYGDWAAQEVHNLLTSEGRDFLHEQGYETSGLGTNGGNYLALTVNSDAAATADTTLTGEITDDGLERAQGTFTHVAGNTTSTIAKTFTATGTHTAVQKSGLFTASTAGTMVHEATFSSVNLATNDQLAVTWTVTLS